MTARVLVVDDILANIKLLEARLTAEYFDVLTAMNGPEALEICQRAKCDVILLDIMMPGMDGFDVCRRLKANPETQFIPVVMVTALDQPSDKIAGLEAGADDFLTKPVSDIALITRVKSLARLKTLTDELRMRSATSRDMGITEELDYMKDRRIDNGRVLIVDDRKSSYERIAKALKVKHDVEIEIDPCEAVFRAAESDYELFVVSLNFKDYDGLRLCSQIRSLERMRHIPVLIVVEPEDNARLLRGLDLGVNDYIIRPVDSNELLARADTQLRRKRYTDMLRSTVQHSMELAITDGLTGLHNRRYLENHLQTLVNEATSRGKPLSVVIVDIDYFKSVNDTHGHDAGDDVLREFSQRIKSNLRSVDLACRYGGEEFVIAMPETDMLVASRVAERLRQRVAEREFVIQDGSMSIPITISAGVASLSHLDDSAEQLLKRADQALYCAKRDGRNRIVADAA